MEKKIIQKFKVKLLKIKEQIINGQALNSKEDLQIKSEDLSEHGDIASNIINQTISFKMRERELNKLSMVNEALERIQYGEYGHCEDCGEPISMKRLENQPWTALCIIHAEEQERAVNLIHKRHG